MGGVNRVERPYSKRVRREVDKFLGRDKTTKTLKIFIFDSINGEFIRETKSRQKEGLGKSERPPNSKECTSILP